MRRVFAIAGATAAAFAASTATATAQTGCSHTDPCPSDARVSLVATQVASPSPGTVGAGVKFTVTIGNWGDRYAANVRLKNPVPAGAQIASALPSHGSCTL